MIRAMPGGDREIQGALTDGYHGHRAVTDVTFHIDYTWCMIHEIQIWLEFDTIIVSNRNKCVFQNTNTETANIHTVLEFKVKFCEAGEKSHVIKMFQFHRCLGYVEKQLEPV